MLFVFLLVFWGPYISFISPLKNKEKDPIEERGIQQKPLQNKTINNTQAIVNKVNAKRTKQTGQKPTKPLGQNKQSINKNALEK